jgi:type IV pilus assembly protein PilV
MSIHSRPARGRRAPHRTKRSDGMTLIEVLVTLVIISVGLLGVAALQLATVRNNYDAFVRSQAAVLAGDLLDRMRANREDALRGDYEALDLGLLTGDTAAIRDINAWKQTLAAQLPAGGDGMVDTDVATGVVTITIQWGERGEVDPVQFRTSSQI